MGKVIDRLMLVCAVLAVVFASIAYHYRGAEHDTAKSETREFPLCNYIDIELLRLDAIIMPYDEPEIKVSYRNEVPLDFFLGDNRLTIQESDEFIISLMGDEESYGLYVYLPREIYRDITVYTGSGDVTVGGVDSEKVTVVTNSGDVLCEGTRSLTYIVTGSGKATLDFYSVIPESMIQTRSGDAEILFPKGSSVALDFETESGRCVAGMMSGEIEGSYMYSFNGGENLIHASVASGTLSVNERD